MNRFAVPVRVLLGVWLWIVLAPLFAADQVARQAAAPAEEKTRLILQVSDADPEKWKLTLNIARNVQLDLGEDNTDIEIVAFGPGIRMLKKDSEMAAGVATARDQGVKIVACENTMRAMKLTYDDMLPKIGFVPAGVVELVKKQQEGYAYIRP